MWVFASESSALHTVITWWKLVEKKKSKGRRWEEYPREKRVG